MITLSKKICMVGDFGVGKTSLIRRFVERQFSDQYLSTVGVKLSRKTLQYDSEQEIKLLIWDIEGKNQFQSIAQTYLQGASGALIVADSTRSETLAGIGDHIDNFLKINPQGVVAVAFNKIDLVEKEEIAYLLGFNFGFDGAILGPYKTSAKTGENVDYIFETIARNILKNAD